ncbi:MAG: Rieske 2Fe-2S domain-containing protein [Nitrososphaerales archaeon]
MGKDQQHQFKPTMSKSQARKTLSDFQRYIGITLIASALLGAYLLATDKSLWLLAASHAYGLIAICLIDMILGIANLRNVTRMVIPAFGWAILTLLLQLADIATAPQYKMTPQYFAGYLFSLWAYDALLLAQVSIIIIGLSARTYQRMLKKKKQITFFDMGLKNSRRDFLQISGTIGALFVLTAALGVWTAISTPGSSNGSQSSPPSNGGGPTSNLPSGAVANANQLQTGVPLYFDYPSSGYSNMLLKKADGSISALSMLCTHVCCQCEYLSAYKEIFCPCHGSVFDQNGDVLRGPAATKLPSIQLSIDANGNIFPMKVVGSGPCV